MTVLKCLPGLLWGLIPALLSLMLCLFQKLSHNTVIFFLFVFLPTLATSVNLVFGLGHRGCVSVDI